MASETEMPIDEDPTYPGEFVQKAKLIIRARKVAGFPHDAFIEYTLEETDKEPLIGRLSPMAAQLLASHLGIEIIHDEKP